MCRAQSACRECLKMNAYQNNLHNVTIVAAAAGGENGTMELISHHGWDRWRIVPA